MTKHQAAILFAILGFVLLAAEVGHLLGLSYPFIPFLSKLNSLILGFFSIALILEYRHQKSLKKTVN